MSSLLRVIAFVLATAGSDKRPGLPRRFVAGLHMCMVMLWPLAPRWTRRMEKQLQIPWLLPAGSRKLPCSPGTARPWWDSVESVVQLSSTYWALPLSYKAGTRTEREC